MSRLRHTTHVLSSRMSTPALGWSRLGASKMARLREWSYNKETMGLRLYPIWCYMVSFFDFFNELQYKYLPTIS
ncbi:hypothetical protein DW944_09900 [Eubacterium ventriosum]|uniref:Uncharacterized protein n=1 Tax=Eubacterium ventriosum TaxID=39496 RepID=A0A413R5V7_9FIRM|nr:hypothetical protein DW944_09900 [Eubacterium ventriosum]RHB18874.1 hypothetical protein DW893_02565 [Eubacterium ventriosum]